MLSLGALLLAAVLLGVPRALRAARLGPVRRPVYVELAPGDPALVDFATELKAAIDGHRYAPAPLRFDQALIVELHALSRWRSAAGRLMEAALLSVRDGTRAVPLVLSYRRAERSSAARGLIERFPS